MSQEDFADNISVHRTTLSKIELGVSFPEVETIENIQKFSGLNYNELFDFENNLPNDKIISNKLKFLNNVDTEFIIKIINEYIKAKSKNLANH